MEIIPKQLQMEETSSGMAMAAAECHGKTDKNSILSKLIINSRNPIGNQHRELSSKNRKKLSHRRIKDSTLMNLKKKMRWRWSLLKSME
jgi:hypothetical protein